jgi:hypothetical protein
MGPAVCKIRVFRKFLAGQHTRTNLKIRNFSFRRGQSLPTNLSGTNLDSFAGRRPRHMDVPSQNGDYTKIAAARPRI